ncbi:MAG: hypothetical protein WCJ64_20015 [Rhodospirillaceae bacterium]
MLISFSQVKTPRFYLRYFFDIFIDHLSRYALALRQPDAPSAVEEFSGCLGLFGTAGTVAESSCGNSITEQSFAAREESVQPRKLLSGRHCALSVMAGSSPGMTSLVLTPAPF